MLFNSEIFFVFALVFFTLLPFFSRNLNLRLTYIIIASFIFYGWSDWRYLILFIGLRIIDFNLIRLMVKKPWKKKWYLISSITLNLAVLGFFKYSLFITSNLDLLLQLLGFDFNLKTYMPLFDTAIPLGISFYTFQSLSYVIDVYREDIKPADNILHYFTFLTMFPHLLAGPINRAKNLLVQLKKSAPVSEASIWQGTYLIVVGYFMKVVLADNLAPFVNQAFSDPAVSTSTLYWWLIMVGFSFQIYFDFAGYSNIARGLANWMGYDFALNFDHPYLASSIRNFWTRWHISLSTWFRDYVYIPLRGSKKGLIRQNFNILLIFFLSGLWHGPAWHFVCWGILHALYIVIENLTEWPKKLTKLKYFSLVITLAIINFQVVLSWVLFRAQNLNQALSIFESMLIVNLNKMPPVNENILIVLFLAIAYEYTYSWRKKIISGLSSFQSNWVKIIALSFLITMIIFFRGPGNRFIYFQF